MRQVSVPRRGALRTRHLRNEAGYGAISAPTTGEHVSTGANELRERLLDWLYARSGGTTTTEVDVEAFTTEAGIDRDTGYELVRDGVERGLMRDESSFDSPTARLTFDGLQAAEKLRQRWADPVWRSAAARTGLLRWLDSQERAGLHMPVVLDVLDSDFVAFAGQPLTTREIDRAAEYLSDKGLIEGPIVDQAAGPVRARLTAEGLDCVENHGGNVAEYFKDQTAHRDVYNIGTLNNSGAIAFGGGDARQQIVADAATIAQTLLRHLDSLEMTEDHRAETRTAAEELQSELDRSDKDAGRISKALGKVVGYVTDAGQPVITALLLSWAHHLGLPASKGTT